MTGFLHLYLNEANNALMSSRVGDVIIDILRCRQPGREMSIYGINIVRSKTS